MIYLVVEPEANIPDTIEECIKLAKKLDVGITTTVNNIQLYICKYSTFEEIYDEYLDAIREQGGIK